MIVARVFDVPGGICFQFGVHVTCCGGGTCPDPDETSYETRRYDPYEGEEVVGIVAGIVHDWLSAAGDDLVSAALESHPATHPAY